METKDLIKHVGSDKDAIREAGRKMGKESRFLQRIYSEIQSRFSKKCIQRNNVSVPSYSNYKTARNGNSPSHSNMPIWSSHRRKHMHRECILYLYEDTKPKRQLKKVSSLNSQDKRDIVWAKLALFLGFRRPHMSSLNFRADDQVSSTVLLWTSQQTIFKVIGWLGVFVCLGFLCFVACLFTCFYINATPLQNKPFFPSFTTVKMFEGLNLQALLMNYLQGFSCQWSYAQGGAEPLAHRTHSGLERC